MSGDPSHNFVDDCDSVRHLVGYARNNDEEVITGEQNSNNFYTWKDTWPLADLNGLSQHFPNGNSFHRQLGFTPCKIVG
jgi:hypothetical protein